MVNDQRGQIEVVTDQRGQIEVVTDQGPQRLVTDQEGQRLVVRLTGGYSKRDRDWWITNMPPK